MSSFRYLRKIVLVYEFFVNGQIVASDSGRYILWNTRMQTKQNLPRLLGLALLISMNAGCEKSTFIYSEST